MKAAIFALLTTYALGHRFVANNMFEEANQSESTQISNAIKESEKQLGTSMGTPMMTERAKRVERGREVDYMGSLENQNFLREEKEEVDETAASLAEAKKEINDR